LSFGAFSSGLLIGLREGVEGALIVAIVLAYLARTGNGRHASRIWLGTGLAIAVSLAAGLLIFSTVGSLQEPYEQAFEGGTMLVAAAVVTWMLFWMRRQAMGLRSELQAAVDRVLTEGTAFGLAILAFTAVIREGIETSLFLVGQATSVSADAGSLFAGALVGLAAAVVVGWLFYTGSRRIDLRAFFRWTGIGLVFIAAGLLSHAVHEFVEIGVIPIGTATTFDISAAFSDTDGLGAFLRAIFGYSASPEVATLVTHVTYLVVVLALYLRPVRLATAGPDQRAVPTTR